MDRRFSAGASPARQRVAPAGSYRSGGGGDEAVGAFETKGHTQRGGDSANTQAGTCSERRAGLEMSDAGAEPPKSRRRPPLVVEEVLGTIPLGHER